MSRFERIGEAPFLDILCPMHAVVDAAGHIVHAGPTLRKLWPEGSLAGRRFLDVLEVKRPRLGQSMEQLQMAAGVRLHLRLRVPPHTELKGVLAPLPQGSGIGPPGAVAVNLSFGISIVDAVRDFALTSGDFAATDLAVEMLYLVEAKSAAMEASRKLNLRLQVAMIAAEEQAFTDTLTGLKNRRAMDHVLHRLTDTRSDFALLHLDLDYFKVVNDTLGHAAGDFVLQRVARILVEETRGEDIAMRTGGDEFVLILAGMTRRAQLSEIAARLIARLEAPIGYGGKICRISGSIGATLSRCYAAPDPARMMRDADLALYAAKARGRGCHVLHDPAQPSGPAG